MTQATSQPLLCNAASNGEPDGYHHLLEQFCHHTLQQHPIYRNNQLAGHIQALVNNYPPRSITYQSRVITTNMGNIKYNRAGNFISLGCTGVKYR